MRARRQDEAGREPAPAIIPSAAAHPPSAAALPHLTASPFPSHCIARCRRSPSRRVAVPVSPWRGGAGRGGAEQGGAGQGRSRAGRGRAGRGGAEQGGAGRGGAGAEQAGAAAAVGGTGRRGLASTRGETGRRASERVSERFRARELGMFAHLFTREVSERGIWLSFHAKIPTPDQTPEFAELAQIPIPCPNSMHPNTALVILQVEKLSSVQLCGCSQPVYLSIKLPFVAINVRFWKRQPTATTSVPSLTGFCPWSLIP